MSGIRKLKLFWRKTVEKKLFKKRKTSKPKVVWSVKNLDEFLYGSVRLKVFINKKVLYIKDRIKQRKP